MKRPLFAAVGIAAFIFAGCGGGGGTAVPNSTNASAVATTAPQKSGTGTASITIKVPAKTGTSAVRRMPAYVSSNTQSVSFAVNGGTPLVVTLALGSATCPLSGGVYTCTAQGNLAAGTNESIVVSTFASTDGSGTPLSTNTVVQTINPNVANPITVTLNGVVVSTSLALSGTLSAGTPTTIMATFSAKDASGATIVGPGSLQDVNGNPVTLSLTSSDTTGAITIGTPTGNAYPVHYTGALIKSPTITASATNMTTLTAVLRVDSAVVDGDFTVAATASNTIGAPWYICSVGHQGFPAGGVNPKPSPVPSPSGQPNVLATPRASPTPAVSPSPGGSPTPFAQLATAVPAGGVGSVSGGYTQYTLVNGPYAYSGAIGICQDVTIPTGTPSLHVQLFEGGDDNFVNSDTEADLYTTPGGAPHSDYTLITGPPVATLFAEDNCWDSSGWEKVFLNWPAGGGTGTVALSPTARWAACPETPGGPAPDPSNNVIGGGGVWYNNTYAIPTPQIGNSYTLFLGTYRGANTFAGGPSSGSAAYYSYAYFTGIGLY